MVYIYTFWAVQYGVPLLYFYSNYLTSTRTYIRKSVCVCVCVYVCMCVCLYVCNLVVNDIIMFFCDVRY